MKLQNVLPTDIEKRSMEIIAEELGEVKLDEEKLSIIKRVIHTSADFDYARMLHFSEDAVQKALDALKNDYPDLAQDAESVQWMKDCANGYMRMGFDYKRDITPKIKIGNRKEQIGLELFLKNKFNTKRPIVGFVDNHHYRFTRAAKQMSYPIV